MREHRVPEWWRDAKLGIFVHWTPASVPGFAPTGKRDRRSARDGRPDGARALAVRRVVRELDAVPGEPGRPAPCSDVRRSSLPRVRRATGKLASRDGIRTSGRRASPPPALATSSSSPSITTATASGRREHPNPHVDDWACPRDVVGELAEAVRAAGMRFGVYYSGGLDASGTTAPARRVLRSTARGPARRVPGVRHRAGPRADRALPADRCSGTTSRGQPRQRSSQRSSPTTTTRFPTA